MIGDREKPRRLTLPPEEALPRIDAITVNARATWFALLGLLAFVGVTLLGVEDIDFFDASRRTDLPLVGVSVPTLTFFYVAPALTAAVYAYFHFYLMKLWDALAEAPATVKGRRLGDLVHPWLVTDAALWFRRHEGATADRPLRIVSGFTAGALSWGFGWAVLGYAWWRSQTAHLEWMSLWLLALFVFSLWVGASSLHAAWRRVGHGETRVRHHGKWPRRAVLAVAAPLAMVSWLRTEGGLERAVVRVGDWVVEQGLLTEERLVAAFAIDGQGQRHERLAERWREAVEEPERSNERFDDEAGAQRAHLRRRMLETGLLSTSWLSNRARTLPPALAWFLILAPINLAEARIVEKPEGWLDFESAEAEFRADWCKRRERPVTACVEPAEGDDDVPDADALKAREHAQADWCGQNGVPEASCQSFFSRQEAALLADWKERRGEYRSTLTRPSLEGRDLRGADLSNAFLPGLNLREARMEGADLWGARMEGAVLSEARMEGAVLSGARMEGAVLRWARMEGADLRQARMEGADLWGAHLKSADLARWTNARTRARLAGFTEARNMTQDHVNALFGDRSTILPDGLRRTDLMDREPRENWWGDDLDYEAWLAAGAPPGKAKGPW